MGLAINLFCNYALFTLIALLYGCTLGKGCVSKGVDA
jgi:hypothetical protein